MCARAAGVCLFQTRDPLTTRRQLKHSVKSNQWIIQLLVDEQYQRLLATHQDGVHIISLRNGNEEHVLPNKHSSSLTCSAVSNRLGYLFTASGDGSINVWSGSTGTFNLIHTLHGHTSTVTGLLAHPVESVIITSSLDGSICMWKLDTMEERNRYDFGVQIEELHLVGTNRLFCKTKDYIYVCHLTLLESFFASIHSPVVKIRRVPASTTSPPRLLVRAEDESIRLVSPSNGSVLTTAYPVINTQCQGLVDVVYARREDRMFALLATHQVLVLDCKTNPSTTLQMWNPSTKDDTPLCISLLDRLDDLVEADILNQIDSTTPLLFAGHKTGKISLLFGGGTSLFDSVKAHQEEVVKLVVSSSLEKDSEDGQMLSVGTDMQLKMWRLETNERLTSRSGLSLQLSCVANISVSSVPRHCVLVRNTVAVIQNNCLVMYRLTKSGYVKTLTHGTDSDHASKVLDLACSSTHFVFATSSMGGSVKIWDEENTLLRELVLGSPIKSVGFCNMKGDLLVGCGKHISAIPVQRYLPTSYLKPLLKSNVKDDSSERTLRFDSDVKFWYDPGRVPAMSLASNRRNSCPPPLPNFKERMMSVQLPLIPSMEVEKESIGERGSTSTSQALRTAIGSDSRRTVSSILPPVRRVSMFSRIPHTDDSLICIGASVRTNRETAKQDGRSTERPFMCATGSYLPNSVVRRSLTRDRRSFEGNIDDIQSVLVRKRESLTTTDRAVTDKMALALGGKKSEEIESITHSLSIVQSTGWLPALSDETSVVRQTSESNSRKRSVDVSNSQKSAVADSSVVDSLKPTYSYYEGDQSDIEETEDESRVLVHRKKLKRTSRERPERQLFFIKTNRGESETEEENGVRLLRDEHLKHEKRQRNESRNRLKDDVENNWQRKHFEEERRKRSADEHSDNTKDDRRRRSDDRSGAEPKGQRKRGIREKQIERNDGTTELYHLDDTTTHKRGTKYGEATI